MLSKKGPWKWSLMHSWFRDGFLPPELPVRRDCETDYTLLKDLCAQSADPSSPFRPPSPPPPPAESSRAPSPLIPGSPQTFPELLPRNPKLLLSPISLLTQPRHYGPPALFFSTRGGHSTTIVDARGRSVLKSRMTWSTDDDEAELVSRMGDVKRVEAFDVNNRAVLVALRQGGFEAADIGDAMLAPADASRIEFPQFNPAPSAINRRNTFVWRIGSAVTDRHSRSPNPATPHNPVAPAKESCPISGRPKTPTARRELSPEEGEGYIPHQELIFLARNGDEVYFCERSVGSFRILRLSPR